MGKEIVEMDNKQNVQERLEAICHKQHEEIEMKKMQIWDLEEETNFLIRKTATLEEELNVRNKKIDDYEMWCAHLQGLVDNQQKEIETKNSKIREVEQWAGQQEKVIRELEQWSGQQAKTIQELNKRTSIVYRMARKIKTKISELNLK